MRSLQKGTRGQFTQGQATTTSRSTSTCDLFMWNGGWVNVIVDVFPWQHSLHHLCISLVNSHVWRSTAPATKTSHNFFGKQKKHEYRICPDCLSFPTKKQVSPSGIWVDQGGLSQMTWSMCPAYTAGIIQFSMLTFLQQTNALCSCGSC